MAQQGGDGGFRTVEIKFLQEQNQQVIDALEKVRAGEFINLPEKHRKTVILMIESNLTLHIHSVCTCVYRRALKTLYISCI